MIPRVFKATLKRLGISAFWLAWPLYIVYFKLSERTRVLITRGDEILVVTNWVSDGKWSLPGGGMHPGETPVAGAVRELREEVGLDIEPERLRLLGDGVYRSYGHSYTFHSFLLEVEGSIVIRKQLHEIADAAWVDYRLLDAKNTAPDVLAVIAQWRTS